MDFVNELAKILPRDNGNVKGLIYVQGRMAAQSGTCVFDNPYEVGSEKADVWTDGYIFEDKKKFQVN